MTHGYKGLRASHDWKHCAHACEVLRGLDRRWQRCASIFHLLRAALTRRSFALSHCAKSAQTAKRLVIDAAGCRDDTTSLLSGDAAAVTVRACWARCSTGVAEACTDRRPVHTPQRSLRQSSQGTPRGDPSTSPPTVMMAAAAQAISSAPGACRDAAAGESRCGAFYEATFG
jgi:hypothetical protein